MRFPKSPRESILSEVSGFPESLVSFIADLIRHDRYRRIIDDWSETRRIDVCNLSSFDFQKRAPDPRVRSSLFVRGRLSPHVRPLSRFKSFANKLSKEHDTNEPCASAPRLFSAWLENLSLMPRHERWSPIDPSRRFGPRPDRAPCREHGS